nr:hypothetical protein Iba_chr07eCG7380 [Ipomoea batatas]
MRDFSLGFVLLHFKSATIYWQQIMHQFQVYYDYNVVLVACGKFSFGTLEHLHPTSCNSRRWRLAVYYAPRPHRTSDLIGICLNLTFWKKNTEMGVDTTLLTSSLCASFSICPTLSLKTIYSCWQATLTALHNSKNLNHGSHPSGDFALWIQCLAKFSRLLELCIKNASSCFAVKNMVIRQRK